MTKTFTPNDVIRYVYKETTLEEKQEIQNVLLWNNDLASFYYEILQIKSSLEKVVYQPSSRVVDKILNFSKSYQMQPTK